jgi:hypothetical protein
VAALCRKYIFYTAKPYRASHPTVRRRTGILLLQSQRRSLASLSPLQPPTAHGTTIVAQIT